MAQQKRQRDWVFTLNNYTQAEEAAIKKIKCTYLVFGHEIAPETGTPHLQGYIYFQSGKSHRAACKKLPRCFVDGAKGDALSNFVYTTKSDKDNHFEIGTRPLSQKEKGETQVKKWDAIKDSAKIGDLDAIPSQIFVQNYRTLKIIGRDYQKAPPDLSHPCGLWIYGESGTGKSHLARSLFPGHYKKPANLWWTAYQNEEVAVLDDMDPFHKSLGRDLKLWADQYSFPAAVHGSQVLIRPKTFVVTSQYHPNQIWNDPETLDAILRRFALKKMVTKHSADFSTLKRALPPGFTFEAQSPVHICVNYPCNAACPYQEISQENPKKPRLERQEAYIPDEEETCHGKEEAVDQQSEPSGYQWSEICDSPVSHA